MLSIRSAAGRPGARGCRACGCRGGVAGDERVEGVEDTTIVIWADRGPCPRPVTKIANLWAQSKGVTVSDRAEGDGPDPHEHDDCAGRHGPDVILGAHDWVGEFAANGSVVPLFPSSATKKQFPAYALDAFSYGTAIKKLYGAPVALENIALVTNTKLAKVPTSFADMEKQALARQEEDEGAGRPLGAAGLGRRRVPHVPALLRPLRLHLRQNAAGNLDRPTSASPTRSS